VRTETPTPPEEAPPPPPRGRPVVRVTSLGVFAAGFLLLVGATAAVAIAQITAKSLAAWLSMGYSAGAFACTVAAVVIGRRHR